MKHNSIAPIRVLICLLPVACVVGAAISCAGSHRWRNDAPGIMAGCGTPGPVVSDVVASRRECVEKALNDSLHNIGWACATPTGGACELFARRVDRPSAVWLSTTREQYLLVILGDLNESSTRLTIALTEYDPSRDYGTSRILIEPSRTSEEFRGVLQEVREDCSQDGVPHERNLDAR